jgi:hypothetical protein
LLAGLSLLTRLASLSAFARLTVRAHLARLAGLIRIPELPLAMTIEAALALTFAPLAALAAFLAVMMALAALVPGVTIPETLALVLAVLMLWARLVEGWLRVARLVAAMASIQRLVLAAVIAIARIVHRAVIDVRQIVAMLLMTAAAVHHLSGLLDLLLSVRQNDAIVVLGVLQIVLGENVIAGGLGVAG